MTGGSFSGARLALPLSILVLTVLGAGIGGCGGGSDTTAVDRPGPGAESGVKAPRGQAEREVEDFGSEAGSSERKAVLSAEQGYLSALADGDFARACTFVASAVSNSLQAVVAPGSEARSCAEILPKLLSASASDVARQQLNGEIVKVRVDGSRGYVVYQAPGARLYVFPMIREGAGWTVSTLTGSVLAPSAATLGE